MPRWVVTPGQNYTLIYDPNPRSQFNVESWLWVTIHRGIQTWGHNSTLNHDPGSNFNVEYWPRSQFNVELLPGITIQRGIMTRDHNSTWNYDSGSKFHVELWPRVRISHWIMIPIPGHNLTLIHDSGSKLNVELRPGVIIQRGIKTQGQNSTGSPNFIRRRVVIQWPPVSGVAIQNEKSVESWAHPVESRPHRSKFNGVKIQSYTG